MSDKDKEIRQLKDRLRWANRQIDRAQEKIADMEKAACDKAEEDKAAAARRVWDKIQKGQLHWQEV